MDGRNRATLLFVYSTHPLTPGNTRAPQDDELLAYQIGFDLVENELQSFLADVSARLEGGAAGQAAAAPAGPPAAGAGAG